MEGRLLSAVEAITRQPAFDGARWGVCAQRRGTSPADDLIDLSADTFFTPASNTKLYTVAAAQARLGVEATLPTTLRLESPEGGSGPTLTLRGGGDPTLTYAQLEAVAVAVAPRLAGGAAVRVAVDVSAFGPSAVPPAWDFDYVSTVSGVLPSAVVVDRNTMRLTVQPAAEAGAPAVLAWEHPEADDAVEVVNTVESSDAKATAVAANYAISGEGGGMVLRVSGSIAVGSAPAVLQVPTLRPDSRAGLLLAEALRSAGVETSPDVTVVERPAEPEGELLHTITSPPLGAILRDCMRPSDNLYAECLLRLLGEPGDAIVETAQAAVSAEAAEAGVDPRRLRLLDGSGMCAKNWVCPRASIQLLQGKAGDETVKWADTFSICVPSVSLTLKVSLLQFSGFLPVAARHGTLAARFHGTPAEGVLAAKTGTLGGVACLSGYYRDVVFSIMVNNVVHAAAHEEIVEAVDAVALALCEAAGSSSSKL
eukprot:COSAG04_NODE_187_length_21001_cov_8.855277_1_plen_481_part_00